MGRWAGSGRVTCEECPSIDVNRWHRGGYLRSGVSFSWRWTRGGEPVGSIAVTAEPGAVVLHFDHSGQSVRQRVYLTNTPCRFGGARPWFECGVCGRRVGRLYISGSPSFACRRCYGLAYASQHEAPRDRGTLRAQRLRTRLGGSADLTEALPDKPKWMRWRTYARIVKRIEAAEARSWAGAWTWLQRFA